jgi:hypothetical protein
VIVLVVHRSRDAQATLQVAVKLHVWRGYEPPA